MLKVPPGQSDWQRLLVFYSDWEGQDDLILGPVRAIEGSSACDVTFSRYWRQGPHIRLDFRVSDHKWAENRRAAEVVLQAWLRSHPAGGLADKDAFIRQCTLLAGLEHEEGPLLPLRQDNTIQSGTWRGREAALGGSKAAHLFADLDLACNKIVYELIEDRKDGDRAMLIPLLMAASARDHYPPLEQGYLSFRSHAEGFMANVKNAEGLRAQWLSEYGERRIPLANAVRLSEPGLHHPSANRWRAVMDWFAPAASELLEEGSLALPTFGTLKPGQRVSDFHRHLFNQRNAVEQLATSARFAQYRMVLNALYRTLARAGISPIERYKWCFLLARGVEDSLSISAPTGMARR